MFVSISSVIATVILVGGVLGIPLVPIYAAVDTDGDGLSDQEEQERYGTDPLNGDSDGDGYTDGEEITHGYSPHSGGRMRLSTSDIDHDGLTDALELSFHTNLLLADSDADGMADGLEVEKGFDPRVAGQKKLEKKIEVRLASQRLEYSLGGVKLGDMQVSTGKRKTPTPKGEFSIMNKVPRAWSRTARLWMPNWMAFAGNGKFGIHELPEWPNGQKEGKAHLGTPVSGGCVRLGTEHAKKLYAWAELGTKVVVRD